MKEMVKTGLTLLAALLASAAFASTAAADSTLTPDGSTMVAWGDLNVRLIAADGVPDPAIHDLDPAEPAEGREVSGPFWAMAPDGTATFAWLEVGPAKTLLQERQAAADGSPLGPVHTLAEGVEPHAGVIVGVAGDGTATVVWNDWLTGEILARRIAPAGTPAAGTLVLNPGSPEGRLPDLAVAPDGTATVVWPEREGEGNVLRSRRIEPDGTLGALQTVGSSSFGMGEPQVAVAPDGTATAIWEQWATPGEEQLLERQISPGGTLSPIEEIEERARFPRLFVGPVGNPLITWTTTGGAFVAQEVEPGGALSPTVMTLHNETYAPTPRVGVAADGTYTIAWASEPCGPRSCVLERRLLPDGTLTPLSVVSESGGIQGVSQVTVAADGSAEVVFSKKLSWIHSYDVIEARKVEADGSLSPDTYEVTAPDTAPLIAAPLGSLQFGSVQVGSQAARSFLLSSIVVDPVGGYAATLTGPGAGQFQILPGTCGPTLGAYPAQCTVEVAFAPTAPGEAKATLVLTAGAGHEPLQISLAGTAMPTQANGEPPPHPGPPATNPGKGHAKGRAAHLRRKHRRAHRLKHGSGLHQRAAHRRG